MATYGIKLNGQKIMHGMSKAEAKEKLELLKNANEQYGIKFTLCIEMNAHERVIDSLIQDAVSQFIGGYENTLSDYAEGTEEYEYAKKILNHDTLLDIIYKDVMVNSKRNYASHIRFAGKQFIIDRIETRLKKAGYGK